MTDLPEEPARDVRFRLLGHPLHATLVHLPLGALISVLVWDILALVGAGAFFWTVAFWSLALGLAATVPAIITGLADYGVIPDDSAAARTAKWHLYTVMGAVVFYGASLLARAGPTPPEGRAVGAAVALGVLGLGFLTLAGYLGAELILRHRVGERRPSREEVTGGPEVGRHTVPDRPSSDTA